MDPRALPEWRRPFGAAVPVSAEDRDRERHSLADAIVDLLGECPLTYDEIAPRVRDEWGGCSDTEIEEALRALVVDGAVRCSGERYRLRGER